MLSRSEAKRGEYLGSNLRHCRGLNLFGIAAVETYYNVANNSKCHAREMINLSGAHLTAACYPYVMRAKSESSLFEHLHILLTDA